MADYYRDEDLKDFGSIAKGQPELYAKFMDWYSDAVAGPGALTQREKALIALAVAHVLMCPYCIDSFTSKCLEAGADLEQMTEAVHVAAGLKAGACLVHAVQMKRKHDSLSM